MPPADDITQANCNRCGRSTNHDILAAQHQQRIDEEDRSKVNESYEMLKCRGCDNVTMRHTRLGGTGDPYIVYYPPPIARRAPLWVSDHFFSLRSAADVPEEICDLMREIYTALQNASHRLAAMGIRAVLERMMIDRVGDRGNFKATMDAFQEAGYPSLRQAGILETVLEAGHAATHRGWIPTSQQILDLLDITESIIENVYLHEVYGRGLEPEIPKRTPRSEAS
jgi:hypothetical protein